MIAQAGPCLSQFISKQFQKTNKTKGGNFFDFSTGTVVPVGADILAYYGWNLNVKTILSSFGIHLPDKEKKLTFAMHSHKISTPTETPVPYEKVKELSSSGS